MHTDGPDGERLTKLEQELAQSIATPLYLIQDPQSGRQIGGTLSGLTTPGTFREYLLDAVEAREKVGRLDER